MKKVSGIFATLLIVGGLGAASVYGHPNGRMEHGMGMAFPMALRGVELSDTQKTQVKEIMQNHRPTVRELLSQLRAIQGGIDQKLYSTENVEQADLTPQIQQISELRNQLSEENLKITLEIRKLLTPEQLAQAAQRREQMKTRWAEMKEQFRQKRAQEKAN